MFRDNPETFIIRAAQIINEQKANAVIEHVEYHALKDTYDTDIFFKDQRRGRLGLDALKAAKSLYDYVIYDSDNEKQFAEKLDTSDSVVVYVKLPNSFFIPTPVGRYNPDWAIAFREGDVNEAYLLHRRDQGECLLYGAAKHRRDKNQMCPQAFSCYQS